jgi:hypothetical protein
MHKTFERKEQSMARKTKDKGGEHTKPPKKQKKAK